ncbi:hypothetical protein PPACK8108_LOCUS24039 [Phakopsora pachyrhizi]|uniref:Uncharacterized protein n=1 Tax=Phakopsora pachyrhizi TaxID=170000 RepID=A0AAV0BQP1_PHAPC|nr:hypothetical protein PPACK8108_LOCUS24039 [Phakopsora pachyrhizi]
MSQYGGYGNPYFGSYYYPNDNQTPSYGYGQSDYVTGHAEGSGSSFHNFEDFQPPMDTQEYILNTKVNMISTHQEAILKAHTCKTMQEVMMITEIFLIQRMNIRSQQHHSPLAATAS